MLVRYRVIATITLSLVAAACPAHHAPPKAAPSSSSPTSTLPNGAPATYLAIDYNTQPGGRVLQLRSSSDGHLIRDLYRSAGSDLLAAARAPDGTIFIFTFQGTTTTMSKVDEATGKLETVRTFSEEVYSPSFDPGGGKLVFVTYPPSYHTAPGLGGALPYELVVLDLKTGARASTVSDNPGHPFFGVVWNPDGTQLATNYAGGPNGSTIVMLLDATHPSFRAARRVVAPRGCSLSASSWIASGLIGAESCSQSPLQLPKALVEYTTSGRITHGWALPQCAFTATAIKDTLMGSVLVFVRSGYGGDTWCQRHNGHYVYELSSLKLRLISRHIEKIERRLQDGEPVAW